MTDETMMSLLPAALRIAQRRPMEFTPGHEYGLLACRPDFTSRGGFRWSFPGQWTLAAGPVLEHDGPCPRAEGDGLCVARTWRGMAAGGIPAQLVLLVSFDPADVLGADANMCRVRRAFVVDALTVRSLLAERHPHEPVDLSWADLRGVDLGWAYLNGADLNGADLSRADLSRADLYGADMRRAYLSGADLSGADLRAADLRGAYLRGADLRGADCEFAIGIAREETL